MTNALIEAADRHYVAARAIAQQRGGRRMSIKVAEIEQAKPAPVPATSRRSPWRLAILFALAAIASGILLTGVSAWFLGAVALAGLGPAALRPSTSIRRRRSCGCSR